MVCEGSTTRGAALHKAQDAIVLVLQYALYAKSAARGSLTITSGTMQHGQALDSQLAKYVVFKLIADYHIAEDLPFWVKMTFAPADKGAAASDL